MLFEEILQTTCIGSEIGVDYLLNKLWRQSRNLSTEKVIRRFLTFGNHRKVSFLDGGGRNELLHEL